jgi:hypothetical protein
MFMALLAELSPGEVERTRGRSRMHALLVNGAVGADKLKKRNMRLLTLQHFHARKGVAAILLLLLAFSLCNSLMLPCRQPNGALVDDD